MANNLHDFPIEEVLTGNYITDQWKPEHIDDLLQKLIPSNVRVTIIAQKFKDLATETEKWYGTKYKMEDIPSDTIKQWEDVKVPTCLALPAKNEFIPTDFELVERDKENAAHPHILS